MLLETTDPLYPYYQEVMEIAWKTGSVNAKEIKAKFLDENPWLEYNVEIFEKLVIWCEYHADINKDNAEANG